MGEWFDLLRAEEIEKAKKSLGLKYGWTHDIPLEMSIK